ncbi:MAG: hypothetical protein ACT4PI_05670 [Actinomycetota bacterium]
MLAAGLGATTYLAGVVAIAAVAVALGWGAGRVGAALLPAWAGAPARLAEVVLALGAFIGVAQLVGAVGAFSPGPMLVALVVVGIGMGVVAARFGVNTGSIGDPVDAKTPRRPDEWVVAAFATALVAAQWTTHVAVAVGSGMTHPDTLWYHQPFAARFLQQGSFTGIEHLGYSESRYFPFNSELVHAVSIMPFDRDVLSPVVNLGWAALALLAAWCIGRRAGLSPLCVLGAVVVLGVPTLAGTNPGQASNDVAAAALLLTAVAFLLEGDLAARPTALAGIAAGLAVGTKLSVVVPVAVLTVGVVVLALRSRQRIVAAAWSAALVVFGGFWFVRNWVVAENPLPFFDVRLGPLHFPERAEQSGPALVGHLFEASEWSDNYIPGLWDALGRAWPVVLALGLGGAVLALGRGRALERLAGGAALAGVVGYVLSPNTAGLSFSFNVRYLAPTLLVGFVLLPVMLERVGRLRWRRPLLIALGGLVVVGATSPHRERIDAWPTDELVPAVLVGLAVLVGAALLARPARSAALLVALAASVAVGAVGGGWWMQRHYLDHRYVDAGLHSDRIYERFRAVRDSRVAVIGTVEVLPMFGLDLSNRVAQLAGAGGRDTEPCARWRALLEGQYRYVVLDNFGVVFAAGPPEEWFTQDASVTEVEREGESVVYRVDGELRPPECD